MRAPIRLLFARLLRQDDLLGYTQAKCYLQLNFYDFNSFVHLLYMLLSALSIPPSRHAQGLGQLANT
jgi:hypothetical protein